MYVCIYRNKNKNHIDDNKIYNIRKFYFYNNFKNYLFNCFIIFIIFINICQQQQKITNI